jgi:uncharacterized membrane-anchored protein YitT (DUF2179 family)
MTSTDWIIDIALILIVLRQLREAKLTVKTILLPVGLIAFTASHYLHGIPTAGHDLLLVAIFTAIGAVFGVFGGLLTRVRGADGNAYIKATLSAAAFWVVSMGFRLGFAIWASHSSGITALAHFSAAHDITGSEAWTTALVLMAFGEVAVRLGIIVARGLVLAERSKGQFAPLAPARVGAGV